MRLRLIAFMSAAAMLFAGCSTSGPTSAEAPTNQKVTKAGVLKPLKSATGDATHTLQTDQGLVMVNSYDVDLNQYNNKKVTITGGLSGETLFVDEIIQ